MQWRLVRSLLLGLQALGLWGCAMGHHPAKCNRILWANYVVFDLSRCSCAERDRIAPELLNLELAAEQSLDRSRQPWEMAVVSNKWTAAACIVKVENGAGRDVVLVKDSATGDWFSTGSPAGLAYLCKVLSDAHISTTECQDMKGVRAIAKEISYLFFGDSDVCESSKVSDVGLRLLFPNPPRDRKELFEEYWKDPVFQSSGAGFSLCFRKFSPPYIGVYEMRFYGEIRNGMLRFDKASRSTVVGAAALGWDD